ncbi:MAG: hypothetical protein B6A08_19415 [Sorangiineae bacterium NIC37A_2]|jgi:expansin (peptidoglycan-binding protein)|nr:MAG: hypothetical protein B6A08_19415 [Sorangiineae bacterium NIC37A_2]
MYGRLVRSLLDLGNGLMSHLPAWSAPLLLSALLVPSALIGCANDQDTTPPFGAGGGTGGDGQLGTGSMGNGGIGSGGGPVGNAGGTGNVGGGLQNAGGSGNAGGGGFGSGGDGAGGGPPSICLVGDPNTMNSELIDDMESEAGISGTQGGTWYASNDGATQQSPTGGFGRNAGIEGPGANGSSYALHTTAQVPNNAEWGATVQLDFAQTVNASKWDGVRVWVKGSGSPRLNLVTAGTLPTDQGGTCQNNCYDSHGVRLSLSGEWKQVKIPFDTLLQEGFGTKINFDPATLKAIALQMKTGGSYDVWIDSIEFYAEEGMPDCANYPGDSRCEPTTEYCSECSQDPRCECLLSTCVETGILEGPLACKQDVLRNRNGGSTRYWISQASSDRDTSGGYEALGCGFPVISKGHDQGSAASQDKVVGAPGGGTLFGALNSADFGQNAALCGACVLINDRVKIQIVDECPNRQGAQGNPSCVSGHIDLSVAAANAVGGDNPGISWKVVECDNAAPEYFWHWDTTTFWGALSIAGLKWPAARVELKDGDQWLEGKRKPYWGAWIFGKDDQIPGSSGNVPPPPWTVRITDIHGQVMLDKFTSPNGQAPNPVQNGTAVPYPSLGMIQLPMCSQ